MSGAKIRFINKDEILKLLQIFAKQLLAEKENVIEISLFGSLVRGNYSPRSDADIYILLKEDPKTFMDRIPEFLDYFSNVGLPVEVFPYTTEEIEKFRDNPFIQTIQKEKLILAKRTGQKY